MVESRPDWMSEAAVVIRSLVLPVGAAAIGGSATRLERWRPGARSSAGAAS